MDYKVTIGIEIHLELLTKTKMFSPAPVVFGEKPNTAINENVLGYPGSLPTVNKKGVEFAIKACHLLDMAINQKLCFDRKHYFYHDLSKGFQITQQFHPIGLNGKIAISNKVINVERLHIEEDTAKTIRKKGKILLDYNRAGNPLVEIVSKPEIKTAKEAVEYINNIKELMFYGGISNAKMEEGSMRCDINISLSKTNKLGAKVEIKNINSTSNVAKAIAFEIVRQSRTLDQGLKIPIETRKFNENTQETVTMRQKQSALDYNYMREPNIAPITLSNEFTKYAISQIPVDSREIKKELNQMGYSHNESNEIMLQVILKDYIIHHHIKKINSKEYYKFLLNDFAAIANKVKQIKTNPESFAKFVEITTKQNKIQKIYKSVLKDLITSGGDVDKLFEKHDIEVIDDPKVIEDILDSLITNEIRKEYLTRKERVEKYLMGQVMKNTQGNANFKVAIKVIKKLLK